MTPKTLLTTSITKEPFLTRKSPLSKRTETAEAIADVVMIEIIEMAEMAAAETEEEVVIEIDEMVVEEETIQEEVIEEKGEAEMVTMVEDHEDIHQATSALNAVEPVTGK